MRLARDRGANLRKQGEITDSAHIGDQQAASGPNGNAIPSPPSDDGREEPLGRDWQSRWAKQDVLDERDKSPLTGVAELPNSTRPGGPIAIQARTDSGRGRDQYDEILVFLPLLLVKCP